MVKITGFHPVDKSSILFGDTIMKINYDTISDEEFEAKWDAMLEEQWKLLESNDK